MPDEVMTSAQYQAMINGKGAKGGKKTRGPIKVTGTNENAPPRAEKPPSRVSQMLEESDVELALAAIHTRTENGSEVEEHKTYRIIRSNGIPFILKPLEP